VEPKRGEFATEVDRLIRAAEVDTTDALCRLSMAQRAFDAAAADLRLRIEAVEAPVAEPAVTGDGALVSRRIQQVFWLALAGSAMIAFALGFWFGMRQM